MDSLPPIDILAHFFRVDEHSRVLRKFAKHGWRVVSKLRKNSGYYGVTFQGHTYPAHRLIWALHHGRHPVGLIDHINGKKWDNRIENLREATPSQNRWNAKITGRPNSTGYENVVKTREGYKGRIIVNYQTLLSPEFDDPELAELAAVEMSCRFRGEFAYERRAA